jgi:hypothetical protein
MKPFLKKIFIFISIPLFFLLISILLIFYISKKIDYKINNNIKEIYIGDSHIQCAINDSLLTNSKNASTGAESFYFSYFKLKILVEQNKQIEKVYLGASYHSLSNYYDQFIVGEFSPSIAPKYFYVLPLKEKIKLIRWNLNNLPKFIGTLSEVSQRYLFESNAYNYGNYSNKFKKSRAVKSSMDKRLNFQYYTGKDLNDFSDINMLYFSKIIELCSSNNIDLILLNTPIHPYFKSKVPAVYINKFEELAKNNNLKVIDFNLLTFTDSSFIPDGDHVSVKETFNIAKALESLKSK